MLGLLVVIVRSLLAGLGSRRELMLENLVLRHQLSRSAPSRVRDCGLQIALYWCGYCACGRMAGGSISA
jgi:hypothetical protein